MDNDPPLPGAIKRQRSADELAELAVRFREDWPTVRKVQTWLNQHEGQAGELTALVELGWSWTDLGRAMQLAGIAYRNGGAISGETLRRKAFEARSIAKGRNTRKAGSHRPDQGGQAQTEKPGATIAPSAGQVPMEQWPRAWEGEPVLLPVPVFRPVTLAGGRKLPPPQDPPQMKTSPVVVEATDDELIARALGRKPKS